MVVCYLPVRSALHPKVWVLEPSNTAVVNFSPTTATAAAWWLVRFRSGGCLVNGRVWGNRLLASRRRMAQVSSPIPNFGADSGGNKHYRAELFEADMRRANFDKLSGICRLWKGRRPEKTSCLTFKAGHTDWHTPLELAAYSSLNGAEWIQDLRSHLDVIQIFTKDRLWLHASFLFLM